MTHETDIQPAIQISETISLPEAMTPYYLLKMTYTGVEGTGKKMKTVTIVRYWYQRYEPETILELYSFTYSGLTNPADATPLDEKKVRELTQKLAFWSKKNKVKIEVVQVTPYKQWQPSVTATKPPAPAIKLPVAATSPASAATKTTATATKPTAPVAKPPAPAQAGSFTILVGTASYEVSVNPKNAKKGETKEQVLALLGFQNAKQVAQWAKGEGVTNLDLCYKEHWLVALELAQKKQSV